MYLSDQPKTRIGFLAVMYLAQGLPWGFVSIALLGYLSRQGATTQDISVVLGMAMAPWPLKWALGPIIDRWTLRSLGRRRPWIIFAQSMMALTTLSMLLIPDLTVEMWTLGMLLMVHNCFVAMQDVGVDALAVDLLKGREREKANGIMYGASHAGSFIGSVALGYVMGAWNLHAALAVLLGLQLAILAFPLLLRERRGDRLLPWIGVAGGATDVPAGDAVTRAENTDIRQLVMRIVLAFTYRSTVLAAILALLVFLGTMTTSVISTRYIMQEIAVHQFTLEGDHQAMIAAFEEGLIPESLRARLADRQPSAPTVTRSGHAEHDTWRIEPVDVREWIFTVGNERFIVKRQRDRGDARLVVHRADDPAASVLSVTSGNLADAVEQVVRSLAQSTARDQTEAAGATRPPPVVLGEGVAAMPIRVTQWNIETGQVRFLVRREESGLGVYRGWTQQYYSAVGGFSVLAGLGASLAGGFLASLVGSRWMASIASVLLGVTWLLFALILNPQIGDLPVIVFMYVDVGLTAMLSVSLWAMFMHVSWPVVAATQFTAYMSLLNVSRLIGTGFAGRIEAHLLGAEWAADVSRMLNMETVPLAFFLAGIIQVSMIVLIMAIDLGQTRRVLGDLDHPKAHAAAHEALTRLEPPAAGEREA